MKQQLRKVFFPLLKLFESGDEAFTYKPSQRLILKFVSFMFLGLAALVVLIGQDAASDYLFPVIIFALIGFTGLIVGFLGTDRAVAKIWGNR